MLTAEPFPDSPNSTLIVSTQLQFCCSRLIDRELESHTFLYALPLFTFLHILFVAIDFSIPMHHITSFVPTACNALLLHTTTLHLLLTQLPADSAGPPVSQLLSQPPKSYTRLTGWLVWRGWEGARDAQRCADRKTA